MPAYNAEKYIAAAIDSIIAQTYTNWELIICDDCSTDNTICIIEEFQKKNPNIKLIKRNINSGGCRLPRFDAILEARGDFVCPIDSDDTIEGRYLEKLIKRQKETNADITLSKIVYCDESLNPKGATIPTSSFDMNLIFTGKEACKLTIGSWEISMNGLIAKTTLYKEYIRKEYNSDFNKSFSDEVDHRKILLSASSISMTDAHYIYRQQPNSIIHSTSINYYNILIANKQLLDIIIKNFSDDNELIKKMYCEYIEKIYRAQQKYYFNIDKYTITEKIEIKSLINTFYAVISEHKMTFKKIKHKILSFSYIIFKIYSRLTTTISKFI